MLAEQCVNMFRLSVSRYFHERYQQVRDFAAKILFSKMANTG